MFEKLLETNLINFLIMFWLLSIIFKKAKLGHLIEKMADDTRKKIEESSKKAANALHDYEETKKGSGKISATQGKIINDAKETAHAIERNIERETQVCEAEIEESFKGSIESLGFKAKKQTLEQLYSACVCLAREQVINNLDPETHRQLIEQGIDEITKMDATCL